MVSLHRSPLTSWQLSRSRPGADNGSRQLSGISPGFGDDKALESDRFTIGVSQHHLLMVRVVITGGPGAGKTTLLTELWARGYATVSESAREIIVARLKKDLPPRPEPAAFAAEILEKDDEKYHRPPPSQGPVFFDRSAVEALAMVHEASPLSDDDLKERLSRYAFHRTVFVLPPWRAIYVNDSARDHPFVHAVAVHGQIVRWYERCGYRINEVPCLGVAQRATHVLAVIEKHA